MGRTLEEFAAIAQTSPETLDTPCFDMEMDICRDAIMVDQIRNDDVYAQNLYAALCNTDWQYQDAWYILQGKTWACSWRHAGAIVAEIRGHGDYIDWYCSGMGIWKEGDGPEPSEIEKRFVTEGMVTEDIASDLARIGWHRVDT